MICLKKIFVVCMVIYAVVTVVSQGVLFADGEDLIVPKGDVLGVVNDPPAIGAGEYTLPAVNFTNLGSFSIQTYRSADGSVEEIQFYFDITDDLFNTGDQIQIYFEVNHDHTTPDTYDRGILIKRDGPAVRRTEVNLFVAPTELGDLPAAQWKVGDPAGSGWTAEVKIAAGDLDLNFIPSLMGMHITVTDGDGGTGTYPDQNVFNVNSWANLKTRNPLEYVLLLDQSGSMLRDFDGTYPPVITERWAAAKKASDIFAQIYHAFKPTEDGSGIPYFNDRIGLATYYWDDGAADEDKSDAIYPLQQLKNITTDGYVDNNGTAPADPVSGQHTPIKRGLDAAFAMFDDDIDAERVVILMSDGIHDRPTGDYDFEGYNYPSGLGHDDFQVNTVALGPDGSVGTDLLDTISTDFSGFGGSYIDTLAEEELVDAFAENLFSHLYLNRVEVNGSGEFEVDFNEPRLLVMLVWKTTTAGNQGFRLKKPDNSIIDTSDASYHHFKNSTLNYEIAYYLLDFPSPTGTWQCIELGTENPEVADNAFALFDPTVYAFFTVTQQGEDFILKAVLKEQGAAITEPDATVKVKVSKPEEGLGTYASTAQPNCTFAEPSLLREYDPQGLLRMAEAARKTVSKSETDPEPLPPLWSKVQSLFSACNKAGLDRSGTTLKMYDDGTHGDSTGGDGIYTLRYSDTTYEGTYTFNFNASGTTPGGSKFSRIKTLSIHKSVIASPGHSITGTIERWQEGNILHWEIYIIPRDRSLEYLGPGHQNQVKIENSGSGNFITPLIDHNNGIYSRVLKYNELTDRPNITIEVQDKPFKTIKLFKAFELTLPYAGYTMFDNALGLKDGIVVGVRLGYRLINPLTFELEAGFGFTEIEVANDTGNWIQLLANLRYDFGGPPRARRWTPFVTAGAGYILFKGFTVNDEAFVFHGGIGTTYLFTSSFGLRFEGRVLRLGQMWGVSATTNYQATGGLVFRW